MDRWVEAPAGAPAGLDGRLGELEEVGADGRLADRVESRELGVGQEAGERSLEACEFGFGGIEGLLGDRIVRALEEAFDIRAHCAEGALQHCS